MRKIFILLLFIIITSISSIAGPIATGTMALLEEDAEDKYVPTKTVDPYMMIIPTAATLKKGNMMASYLLSSGKKSISLNNVSVNTSGDTRATGHTLLVNYAVTDFLELITGITKTGRSISDTVTNSNGSTLNHREVLEFTLGLTAKLKEWENGIMVSGDIIQHSTSPDENYSNTTKFDMIITWPWLANQIILNGGINYEIIRRNIFEDNGRYFHRTAFFIGSDVQLMPGIIAKAGIKTSLDKIAGGFSFAFGIYYRNDRDFIASVYGALFNSGDYSNGYADEINVSTPKFGVGLSFQY